MIMFLSMTLGFWLMACTYWLTARGSNFAESTQIVSSPPHWSRVQYSLCARLLEVRSS